MWSNDEKVVLPLTLFIIVILSILITYLIKGKSQRIKKLPFILIAAVLLILEVIKQINAFPDYSLWTIPLHFCSTFMIWFSIASFTKGKLSDLGFSISVTSGFLFLILFYINPSSIIGNSSSNILGSFGEFHTFIYHHTIILFMLLAIFNNMFKPKLKHALGIFVLYTIYAILAIIFANVLDVNFTNLLQSNIGFMQLFLDNYGKILYTIVMYLFGLFGLEAGLLISVFVSKFKNKKLTEKYNMVKE